VSEAQPSPFVSHQEQGKLQHVLVNHGTALCHDLCLSRAGSRSRDVRQGFCCVILQAVLQAPCLHIGGTQKLCQHSRSRSQRPRTETVLRSPPGHAAGQGARAAAPGHPSSQEGTRDLPSRVGTAGNTQLSTSRCRRRGRTGHPAARGPAMQVMKAPENENGWCPSIPTARVPEPTISSFAAATAPVACLIAGGWGEDELLQVSVRQLPYLRAGASPYVARLMLAQKSPPLTRTHLGGVKSRGQAQHHPCLPAACAQEVVGMLHCWSKSQAPCNARSTATQRSNVGATLGFQSCPKIPSPIPECGRYQAGEQRLLPTLAYCGPQMIPGPSSRRDQKDEQGCCSSLPLGHTGKQKPREAVTGGPDPGSGEQPEPRSREQGDDMGQPQLSSGRLPCARCCSIHGRHAPSIRRGETEPGSPAAAGSSHSHGTGLCQSLHAWEGAAAARSPAGKSGTAGEGAAGTELSSGAAHPPPPPPSRTGCSRTRRPFHRLLAAGIPHTPVCCRPLLPHPIPSAPELSQEPQTLPWMGVLGSDTGFPGSLPAKARFRETQQQASARSWRQPTAGATKDASVPHCPAPTVPSRGCNCLRSQQTHGQTERDRQTGLHLMPPLSALP